MRVTSARRLVAMAAAAALGSAGVVLSTHRQRTQGPRRSATRRRSRSTTSTPTPYPSPITVSGMEGTITAVTVTLTGPLRRDPAGRRGRPGGAQRRCARDLDELGTSSGAGRQQHRSHDLRQRADSPPECDEPGDGHVPAGELQRDQRRVPGARPGRGLRAPGADGTATLSSVFGGDGPNGTWNLFVRDFFTGRRRVDLRRVVLSITTTELLQDGGFEAGTVVPIDSPAWTEADTVFDSSVQRRLRRRGPARRDVWAWFGGTYQRARRVYPDLDDPDRRSELSFYLYRNATPAPLTPTCGEDGRDGQATSCPVSTTAQDYSQQTVDLSTYADGNSHTLSFDYGNPDARRATSSSMAVDDVSIDRVTAAPSVTGTPDCGHAEPSPFRGGRRRHCAGTPRRVTAHDIHQRHVHERLDRVRPPQRTSSTIGGSRSQSGECDDHDSTPWPQGRSAGLGLLVHVRPPTRTTPSRDRTASLGNPCREAASRRHRRGPAPPRRWPVRRRRGRRCSSTRRRGARVRRRRRVRRTRSSRPV